MDKAKAASIVYALNWCFRCHNEADMSDFGFRNTNGLLLQLLMHLPAEMDDLLDYLLADLY